MSEFAVRVEEDARGGCVVGITGELDMATSSELEEALEQREPDERVVVDLTECEFLDSSGVRVLLTAAVRVQSAGGSFSLVASDRRIRRVLEIAGVEARVPIHATRDAAFGA